MIAPKHYIESQGQFGDYLTYEAIKEYFESYKDNRLKFKAKLLSIAIEKSRRGYQPINCEPVQKFWQSYWEYKEKNYPNLKMKRPSIVPLGSDWPQIQDAELEGVIFYHKLKKGVIDATFRHFSKKAELKIQNLLPDHYILGQYNSGYFFIRERTDSIDRTIEFEGQAALVEIGMKKMNEMSKWIKQNINNH